jgi:hypothetical protein
MEFTEIDFAPGYFINRSGDILTKRRKTPKLLKLQVSDNGYLRAQFYINHKPKKFAVHVLVAMVFIPNDQNLPQVNHKDCNKKNNYVTNLEWCSCQYNIQHGIDNGRRNTPKGSSHFMSKLKESDVIKIKELCRQGELSQYRVAEIFNVSQSTIAYIITGKTWKHLK